MTRDKPDIPALEGSFEPTVETLKTFDLIFPETVSNPMQIGKNVMLI